jgi:hypothetical protein
MKRFAYIENNEVKQIGGLPTNWNNISNFYLLNPEDENDLFIIKQNGWFPIETISENKEIQVAINYVIEDECVKEIIVTRDRTQEEIEEQDNINIQSKWHNIRNQRNNLLKESDMDVVSDKWEQMSLELKTSLSTYRQELRDLPQNFSTPDDVVWPNKP